tara:strand:+ start:1002 stop:1487 length:486 start_codon:yes stop_codon:yes gene_type:complete
VTLNKQPKKHKWSARPRTAARLAAVQALYQMKMTGAAPTDIIEEFVHFRLPAAEENHGLGTPDTQLFRDLISGTARDINHIDPLIASALSKEGSLDKLETTLQAILQVGVFELISPLETPAEVVINEYVDLTHAFFEKQTVGLVNGVLDKVALLRKKKNLG